MAGNGTYLTMPSNCAGGQTIDAQRRIVRPAARSPPTKKRSRPRSAPTGCENVPFKPTIAVTPQGGAVDSPEATTVNVGIPFDPTEPIANSYLKTAKVTLPEGMGLNPSSANGLVPCTDAQFAKGTNDPITCPDASKIGTVEVQTPSLPADSLGGTVYVGEPKSNDPTTGEQFRIFIHVDVDPLRRQRALDRKGVPEPADGPAHRRRRRKPAGDVQLLQGAPQRRSERDADDARHLRPAHDDD